jgi:Baseplate J-like protein
LSVPPNIVELQPVCGNDDRRAFIRDDHPVLNGIDYVEVSPDQLTVRVYFLKALPQGSSADGAYDLTNHPEWVRIFGGVRIVDIHVMNVARVTDHLEIAVDTPGDFSDYQLTLGWVLQPDGSWTQAIPELDLQLSRTVLNFKAGCPVDFDCRNQPVCPPDNPPEPLIDYMAKDYASFRQLLLDSIPQLNPGWLEQNPADLGIALVELLAYTGDYLSYYQDAIANEAYLATVRQRVSAKRHARLVDYQMHDGRNAWMFVHFQLQSAYPLHTAYPIPQGSLLLTRISAPLRHQSGLPGTVILKADFPDDAFDFDPALSSVQPFETTFRGQLFVENNLLVLHDWGNTGCCLPAGATSAYLYSAQAGKAVPPTMAAADYLLIEEALGPVTANAADADPAHRQVVQLISISPTTDHVFTDTLQANGRPEVWKNLGDPFLPLLHVVWRDVDALSTPYCLSSRPPGGDTVFNISVARGNIVLADHGHTLQETVPAPPPDPFGAAAQLPLTHGPMTMQMQPATVTYNALGVLVTPRTDLTGDPRQAIAAVSVLAQFPTDTELWTVVPDLLESPAFAQEFVADVGDDGRATLRFGDDEYGRDPGTAQQFTAIYRVGNGTAGNVGAESVAHLVQPANAPIMLIRNPLPAVDGVDAETIEQVRQYAPAAFHAEQFRAVTEADYVRAAAKMPEVAGAVAAFRWTGSWYTVYVGIAPRNPADLITLAGGRTLISPDLQSKVEAFLTTYRLAGYDLEIRSANYVAIQLAMDLCVAPDYFRSEVEQAVLQALSNRRNPDLSLGFFYPTNLGFGKPVYLSKIYAAIQAVQGVDSVTITTFQRYGQPANGEIENGVLPIGPWEIARLDDDPNFMENGVLQINPMGGK